MSLAAASALFVRAAPSPWGAALASPGREGSGPMVLEMYQIRVNIIEARSLKGNESSGTVSPIGHVRLTAGDGPTLIDQSQYTSKVSEQNSVFWNETKIFQLQLTREQFNSGKVSVMMEDSGLFTNSAIGSAQFDLPTVYDYPSHEIYGQWAALMLEGQGGQVQGYLRISIAVLREQDTPKIHGPNDLEENEEPEMGVVMGMPDVGESTGILLIVRINKVELAPYGLDKPKMQVSAARAPLRLPPRRLPPRLSPRLPPRLSPIRVERGAPEPWRHRPRSPRCQPALAPPRARCAELLWDAVRTPVGRCAGARAVCGVRALWGWGRPAESAGTRRCVCALGRRRCAAAWRASTTRPISTTSCACQSTSRR